MSDGPWVMVVIIGWMFGAVVGGLEIAKHVSPTLGLLSAVALWYAPFAVLRWRERRR